PLHAVGLPGRSLLVRSKDGIAALEVRLEFLMKLRVHCQKDHISPLHRGSPLRDLVDHTFAGEGLGSFPESHLVAGIEAAKEEGETVPVSVYDQDLHASLQTPRSR